MHFLRVGAGRKQLAIACASGKWQHIAITYDGSGWTVGEWLALDGWINAPTGSIIEIEYDADGTPQINEDGTVELVQP